MNSSIDWPPPFTLQTSTRARKVRLHVCTSRGLRLIVPLGFNPKIALGILQKHRSWIERTWLRVYARVPAESELLPEKLHLRALDEIWQIEYAATNTNSVRVKVNTAQYGITISGQIQDQLKVNHALRKWLHCHAQYYLFPWIEGLSKETGSNED